MSIFDKLIKKRSQIAVWTGSLDQFNEICGGDFTPLDKNPEIVAACRKIADLISMETIHLYANTENGDVRILNQLSRKVDINPWTRSTRKSWMESNVMNLLLYGKGNAIVFPTFDRDGYLLDLEPIAPDRVGFKDGKDTYYVIIDGAEYRADDLIHFVYNPDKRKPWKGSGTTVYLKDVAKNLDQAGKTKNAFMSSKWKPSMVIMVDGLVDEFSNPEGRKKLLTDYVETANQGEPWLIPANQFKVEQIRPLSLSDLALNDAVQLDKRTVASILGVPPFVLGVGEFKRDEWNNFVNTTVHAIAQEIQQELTKKLLLSEKMYFRLNLASLYAYDLKTTADVYQNLYVRGLATGNEVRDKIGMQPLDGLDQLVILENFIPADKIGDQSKLNGGDE